MPSSGICSNVDDVLQLMSFQIKHYRNYSDNPWEAALLLTSNVAETGYEGPGHGYGPFKRRNRFDHFGLDRYGGDHRFTPKFNIGMVCPTSSGGVWRDDLMDDIHLQLLDAEE